MKEVVNEGNTHKANLLVVRFVFVIVHITFVSMEYLLLHTALVLPLFQLQIRLHVHQHIHVVINFGNQFCLYALCLSCQVDCYCKKIPYNCTPTCIQEQIQN